MVRQIIVAGFVVFLPAGLGAQGRGAMPSVSRAVHVAPRAVMPAPQAMTAHVVAGTRTAMSGGALRPKTVVPGVRGRRPQLSTQRPIDEQSIGLRSDCSSAPGLGFDAVHLAATCGSGVLRFGPRGYPSFFPFFDGGWFVPSSPLAVDEGPAAETPQPETTDAEAAETRRRYRAPEPATAPVAETASSGPPDHEEFVFVRRDGTVFFAVAYSWEKGTLHYITSQGLPRTITEDTLDLDATRQFNEQRGLSFRLPP